MSVAIGLDVGTSGVKALAVAEDGEIVGRAEVEYGLSTPKPGWAEQDPEDWWRGTQQALEQLGVDEVAGPASSARRSRSASGSRPWSRRPATAR
ncbi:MAG TPA: FGGY family carbohydrate kinase [Solirubrobacteraceae bacterium]|nr:FGGY family carbohydrate kinase [Solirubrobacteraceae bacterium]